MTWVRAAVLAAGVWAVVAVAGAAVLGVPVGWAVLIGLPAAALTYAAASLSGTVDAEWAPLPEPPGGHVTLHATYLTERLEQSAGDQYRFTTRVQPRLRRVARAALREDLDSPAARDKLGPDLHRLLTAPDAELPSPRTFAALMRRLEELC